MCCVERWSGHDIITKENESVRRDCDGRIEGGGDRGRPPVAWREK